MGEVFVYDATHLTTVREGTTEFRQSAELGGVGGGRVVIDDEAGTQAIVGQKDFSATQSACSIPLTFRGYVADRTYGRNAGVERAPHVGASRSIAVDLVDTNAMLGFRLIDDTDGNRSRETIAARAAWLLASDYVTGLFTDEGRCTFSSTIEMTKADYRNQYPGDVLADMALASGYGTNYHVNDYGSGPELTFRNDNTSTADSSTLRVSNVLADATSVTLHPFKDATLTRSPANVYSKIAYSYAKGTVYKRRASTETTFNGERGGQASNSNVNTSAIATDNAKDLLSQHATEEDIIECTVLTTDAQVNLMPPGWRIQGKFSHLNTEGYGSFTWFRILEVMKKPIVADGALYEVTLKLSPQETAPVSTLCADLYDQTPSGTYYPLGGDNGSGAHPFASDGVVHYWRAGLGVPDVPGLTEIGSWHFGVWGLGGLGTTDWAGDCTGNTLILVTSGDGEWTIATEMYAGSPRTLEVKTGPELGTAVLVDTISSGASTVVTVDDTTDADCIRVTTIRDTSVVCGGKWGFSGAVWVAA